MSDERRSNNRVTVNLVVKWGSLSGSYEAKLEDISETGCFINTTGQVELDEILNLDVLLPSGEWLTLSGQVKQHQPGIGFGVMFSDLTKEQEQAVAQLCGNVD